MKKSEYTQEFKDSTIQLASNSEESTSKIAKDLGMNKHRWEAKKYEVDKAYKYNEFSYFYPYVQEILFNKKRQIKIKLASITNIETQVAHTKLIYLMSKHIL
jgi:hypothetical protein